MGRELSAREGNWPTLLLGDIRKYEDLALQIVGVSNETVRCGNEFCGTWT
jgi:hypothetical protein